MALLIRAFSIFSQLANIADDHLVHVEAGARAAAAAGIACARQRQRACAPICRTRCLSPVITAHPTEVRRKSILDRETDIGALAEAARTAPTPTTGEVAEIEAQLKREIRTLWQTRMLRPIRIHVTDEIENAICGFLAHLPDPDSGRQTRAGAPVRPERRRPAVSEAGLLGRRRPRRQSVRLRPDAGICGPPPGRSWCSIIISTKSTRWAPNCRLSDEFISTSAALKALAAGPDHTSLHQMDEPYRRALATCYSRLAATRKALLGRAPDAAAALGGRSPTPRRKISPPI